MNILFITSKNVNPVSGGIERSTYILATAFTNIYTHLCYSAYLKRDTDNAWPYAEELHLQKGTEYDQLKAFVEKNSIEVIIAQGSVGSINQIVDKIGAAAKTRGAKLVFSFRNMPGFELVGMDSSVLLYRILHCQQLLNSLGYLIYQTFSLVARPIILRRLKGKYSRAYYNADRITLLSERFVDDYAQIAGTPTDEKYKGINNALIFDECFNMEDYDSVKKKTVLFVGRFEERQKRVTEVIQVWKMIERSGSFPEWQLRMVGSGEDELYYKKMVKRLKLKRVSFEGPGESRPYYSEASIFMMTSAFEGFGNVLTESLQNAVVPVAYDSYKALHDIIQDGVNCFIVPDHNRKAYCNRMMRLMSDNELRKKMAANGIQMTSKFSIKKIAGQWNSLITNLYENI